MRNIKPAFIALCLLTGIAPAWAVPVNLRNTNTVLPFNADFVTTLEPFSAPRTITLPQAANFNGSSIQFYDSGGAVNGANTITFIPDGTDLLNGGASLVISTAGANTTFVRSPTGWYATTGGGGNGTFSSITINTPINTQTAAILSTQVGPLIGLAAVQYYNKFTITQDALDASSFGSLDGWRFEHTFGGSNLMGARQSIDIRSFFTAPSSASPHNRNYVPMSVYMDVNASDNGTDTGAGAKGAFFGLNPVVRVHSNVLNLAALVGIEVDIETQPTSTFKSAVGYSAVSIKQGVGADTDSAFRVGTFPLMTGWRTAFLLTNNNGAAPLINTGCVICTTGEANTIATGMDLSTYTISGNFLKGPSSQVTGVGFATFANLAVTSSTVPANGMYLSGANTVAIAANSTGLAFLSGTTLGLGAPGTINAGDWLAIKTNSNASQGLSVRNSNTGAAGAAFVALNNGTIQGVISYTSTGATPASSLSILNNSITAITISSAGLIAVPAIATGTPTASVCIDASNIVIKKTTAGACI